MEVRRKSSPRPYLSANTQWQQVRLLTNPEEREETPELVRLGFDILPIQRRYSRREAQYGLELRIGGRAIRAHVHVASRRRDDIVVGSREGGGEFNVLSRGRWGRVGKWDFDRCG